MPLSFIRYATNRNLGLAVQLCVLKLFIQVSWDTKSLRTEIMIVSAVRRLKESADKKTQRYNLRAAAA